MRERILTAKDQGRGKADNGKPGLRAAPLPAPFVPAPFHRSHYYRDPASRTFHIFPLGAPHAVCGVSRMAQGRSRGWTNLTCPGHRICRACLRAKTSAPGKPPRQGAIRERILLKIDAGVLAEIDARVGRDKRVAWIQSAIRHTLAWEDEQKKTRDEKGGAS